MAEIKKSSTSVSTTNQPGSHQNQEDVEIENLTFEQALAELEQIVADLESGRYNLAEVLNYYQRGQKLAQHCSKLLDNADLVVRQMTASNDKSIPEE